MSFQVILSLKLMVASGLNVEGENADAQFGHYEDAEYVSMPMVFPLHRG